jgi:type III pantothenate kinase
MLLVIDIGNTNSVLGLYDDTALVHHWRLQTNPSRTEDEYGVLMRQLFETGGLAPGDVTGAILASVVPPMSSVMTKMVVRYFGIEPLVVGPGMRTGMPIRYENPREVGADRIVNAIAAFERTRGATIVVDFGTATTFDAISERGDYLGGAICPGVTISADALYQRASKLPRVDIAVPDRVIGRNTVASMQAGIVWGYVSMIDGMVDRMVTEYGAPMAVLATGGLSALFAEHCVRIDAHDPDLTLDGLRIIYGRNQR